MEGARGSFPIVLKFEEAFSEDVEIGEVIG
jgi:hypothetical protein